MEAVVETNALFSRNSIKLLMAGELPHNVNNMVLRHVLNQELMVEVALTKNRDLALNAFTNNPLVTIDIKCAEELFNQMLENTKK
jgi:alpha-galactosidase/6-phospho-beta-glucosidase family protein